MHSHAGRGNEGRTSGAVVWALFMLMEITHGKCQMNTCYLPIPGSGWKIMRHWKKYIPILISFMIMAGPFISNVRAEFYKYVDKNGKTRYVDDLSKIPEEYLDDDDDIRTYQERKDFVKKEDGKEFSAMQWKETPVRIINNRILVPVKIGVRGTEVRTVLLLDTGASLTALHRNVIKRLPIREFHHGKARIASGQVIDSQIAKLDYIQVGPYKKKYLYAGVIDYMGPRDSYQGLLGMNFLGEFKYQIDVQRQVIKWQQ